MKRAALTNVVGLEADLRKRTRDGIYVGGRMIQIDVETSLPRGSVDARATTVHSDPGDRWVGCTHWIAGAIRCNLKLRYSFSNRGPPAVTTVVLLMATSVAVVPSGLAELTGLPVAHASTKAMFVVVGAGTANTDEAAQQRAVQINVFKVVFI